MVFQYWSQVSACEISSQWRNLKPSYVQKCKILRNSEVFPPQLPLTQKIPKSPKTIFQHSSVVASCAFPSLPGNLEQNYVRKSKVFEIMCFSTLHPLKQKMPNTPERFFSIYIQSLHVQFHHCEITWSRIMLENLFFDICSSEKFSVLSPYHPLKLKTSKSPNLFFQYSSLFAPCAILSP